MQRASRHKEKNIGGGGEGWQFARNVGKAGYETSSSLGKLSSYVTLVSGIGFGLLFVLIAWWVLASRYGDEAVRLRGSVVESKCSTSVGKNTTTSCNVEVQYVFQGNTYTTHVTTSKPKSKDQTIKLVIPAPEERPQDAKKDNDAIKFYAGWGIMGLGILIVIGSIVTFYVVQNNKMASAAYGVGSAVSLVS